MQEKSQGSASRNSFLNFVWCVAEEQNNNNNENRDSSEFYWYNLIVRIESFRSESESSAGKQKKIQWDNLSEVHKGNYH